jgi:hypothetical protein
VTRVGTTLFGMARVPNVTDGCGTVEPCERMLMLPVPRGTVNWTVSLTTFAPNAWAGSAGVLTGAACAGSQAVVGAAVVIAGPTTMVAVPGGVHAGDAVAERHAPATQDESGAAQSVAAVAAVHEGKQKDPVEVLTHFALAGHVLWSFGLHAAVQAPPGNSGLGIPGIGSAAQSSPAAHPPAGHALPRSALAGLACGGQFACGTQAPRPGQQV